METVDILGVKISKVGYESAIERIERFLAGGGQHWVVTPNPEFIVRAQKDCQFREILNRADLALPDGVGLRLAAKFLSLKAFNPTIVRIFTALVQGFAVGLAAVVRPSYLDVLPYQVTGTDLMIKLCDLAAQKGYTVFLLGGREGVATAAAQRLQRQFANIKIVGTYSGDPREDFDEQTRAAIVSGVDLLFVAYGAPVQEKWIARNLPHLPVKVALGVGGALDFISGRKKRAPRILRQVGLEWLYRLLQEPWRRPRILMATVKFPLLVFGYKLHQSN